MKATSAESNAVLPGLRARSGVARFKLAKLLRRLANRSTSGQLAQVALGDVGLAAAVQVPARRCPGR